jgi:hypothetical protein
MPSPRFALSLSLLLAGAGVAAADNDGSKSSAAALALDAIVTDDVSLDRDAYDWRKVELTTGGYATCTLHWDDESAELALDLLDPGGAVVASAAATAGAPKRKVSLEVESTGVHYVRVSAFKGASSYTMKCRWAAVAGTPISKAPPEDAEHPRCKVVSHHRDSKGRLVIYLESGGKVQKGMRGQLIDDTDSFVPGGEFTIDKVADATKSVGVIAANTLSVIRPKQTRCVLYGLFTNPF